MSDRELTPVAEYMVETAEKELAKAIQLMENKQRAKAQHHLREARQFMDRTPSWYTNDEFQQKYDHTFNVLYRGYA